MKKLLYYPIESSSNNRVPLGRQPKRVWTIMPLATDPKVKPPMPELLVHNVTVFIEDYVHDWNWRQGQFSYYSRVSSGRCWLLLEFPDEQATQED